MNTYTPKGAPAKTIAIRIARDICAGDIARARIRLATWMRPGVTASDARAIVGACKFFKFAYGVALDPSAFMRMS